MKMRISLAVAMVSLLVASTALAAGPTRRVQRHSQTEQLAQMKITGRSSRPQVVIDLKRREHKFAVGTMHLSPKYGRFAKPGDSR